MQNQIAVVKNSELLTQDVKSSKSGDVEIFKDAAQNRKLKHVHVERIKEALRLIFVKVGLRAANLPNETEKVVLINFIYNNYPNHSVEEIALAFDLAILGKLECEAKHYENFTCIYLAEVMTAYRKWAVNQSQQVKTPPPKMLFGNQITTQEEKLQDIADWEAKAEYNINHVPPFLYDYLIEFEKINPTNADKWEAMRKATEILKTQLYTDSLNMRTDDVNRYQAYLKMFESGEYTGDTTHRLKLLAKRVMIIDYLNSKK